jgi:hypothetical protein
VKISVLLALTPGFDGTFLTSVEMDPEKSGDRHGRKRGKRGAKKRGSGPPFGETAEVSTPPASELTTPPVPLQAAALEVEAASQPSLSPAAANAKHTEYPVDAGASALGVHSLGQARTDEPMTKAGITERLRELQLSDEEEEELMTVLARNIGLRVPEQAVRVDRAERARDTHYDALCVRERPVTPRDIRVREQLGPVRVASAASAGEDAPVEQMEVGPGAPLSTASAGESPPGWRPARPMEFFGDSMHMRPLFFTGDITLPAGSFLGVVTSVPLRPRSGLDQAGAPQEICSGTTMVLQLDEPMDMAARIGAVPARAQDVAAAAALARVPLPPFVVDARGDATRDRAAAVIGDHVYRHLHPSQVPSTRTTSERRVVFGAGVERRQVTAQYVGTPADWAATDQAPYPGTSEDKSDASP